jgi:hypothetical protein
MGYYAQRYMTDSGGNIGIGRQAQQNANGSGDSVAIGNNAQEQTAGSWCSVAIGNIAMYGSTNCYWSTYVGPSMGIQTVNATACGGLGVASRVLNNSYGCYVYGAWVTNDFPNCAHVFGNYGAKYCAFTKDVAEFYVPVKVPAGGDIPMGSFTNSP